MRVRALSVEQEEKEAVSIERSALSSAASSILLSLVRSISLSLLGLELTSVCRSELIKKCYRCERGEPERVGACLFPGLVKESAIDTTPLPPQTSLRANGGAPPPKKKRETRRVVVRRAQVICE